jgi:hypothetical protein
MPERLSDLIESITCERWVVLTDSVVDARDKLSDTFSSKESISFMNLPPREVLSNAIESRIFIGTTSKISVWAAVFRSLELRSHTYMPEGFRETFANLLSPEKLRNINYY